MRSIRSHEGLTRGRGLTESVLLRWVYSMHKSTEVNDAMTIFMGHKLSSSEQHTEH
uniref:Uncharacterized protein n=1 Tax=Amphimedon queenslandica TaxID=400682 RepID=A0A1X7U7I8_AMPQE